MHTIVISTDKSKVDEHLMNNLKRLFPECKIKIHRKNSKGSGKSRVVCESVAEKINQLK